MDHPLPLYQTLPVPIPVPDACPTPSIASFSDEETTKEAALDVVVIFLRFRFVKKTIFPAVCGFYILLFRMLW